MQNRRSTLGAHARDGLAACEVSRFVFAAACCLAACCLAACSEKPSDDSSAGAGSGASAAGSASVAPAATGGAGGTDTGSSTSTSGGAGGAGGASAAAAGAGGSGAAGASNQPQAGMGAAGMASAGNGGVGGSGATDACSREQLKAGVDAYFTALSAHDATQLPLAASVKLTENGETITTSEGMWSSAGMVKFQITAVDTTACSTVTEAVVPDGSTDIPFGVRLAHVAGEITEIETVAVRSGDYFVASNTKAIADTDAASWETLLPVEQQTPRAELEAMVNEYFMRFPIGACGFADDCTRLENGFSPGKCVDGSLVKCDKMGSVSMPMTPRLILVDVEAGIAVGFVMFAGSYTDFHMFKVASGEVHSVHAVLGSADSSGWD